MPIGRNLRIFSDDTLTRTIGASDCGTDATFGSTCHYEAIEHAAYVLQFMSNFVNGNN